VTPAAFIQSALATLAKCRLLLVLLTVFSALLNVTFAQASTLKTFEANYAVENDYITGGIATLRLAAKKDSGYLFSLRTKPTGIFRLTRNGKILEQSQLDNLDPPFISSRYDYVDKGRSKRSYHIEFDRDDGSYHFNRNGSSSTHPLEPQAIDRLSVTLALLHETRSNPDFKTLDVEVVDEQKTEPVTYSNQGSALIRTSIGEFNAIQVTKKRRNSTRETIIWLAEIDQTGIVLPLKSPFSSGAGASAGRCTQPRSW